VNGNSSRRSGHRASGGGGYVHAAARPKTSYWLKIVLMGDSCVSQEKIESAADGRSTKRKCRNIDDGSSAIDDYDCAIHIRSGG
jgi:hypothetical protein